MTPAELIFGLGAGALGLAVLIALTLASIIDLFRPAYQPVEEVEEYEGDAEWLEPVEWDWRDAA